MKFYDRHILPLVLDCACATKPIRKQREKIIPLAHGDVVEIGIGSGHNLPYYDQDKVTKLIGIDPDANVWKKAAPNRAKFHKPLERLGLSGESIPLPDACADTVVVTYSLCTIPDPIKALGEMKRLLKPGANSCFASTVKPLIPMFINGKTVLIQYGNVYQVAAIRAAIYRPCLNQQGSKLMFWKRCTFPAPKFCPIIIGAKPAKAFFLVPPRHPLISSLPIPVLEAWVDQDAVPIRLAR